MDGGVALFLDGNDGQQVYIDEYEASLVNFWCLFTVIVMIRGQRISCSFRKKCSH
jgi:hypothetical protein